MSPTETLPMSDAELLAAVHEQAAKALRKSAFVNKETRDLFDLTMQMSKRTQELSTVRHQLLMDRLDAIERIAVQILDGSA